MSDTNQTELVQKIIEVTGASIDEARNLLSACENNVEAAIQLFFDQSSDVVDVEEVSRNEEDNDGIRAPIAPIREQLIRPEDDNFLINQSAQTAARLTRAAQRFKVCPLRDFAREGELLEQQIQAAAAAAGITIPPNSADTPPQTSTRRRARAGAMVATARATATETIAQSSRLEDLFRPPTDIAYLGTFQSARTRATELKHWLLVNVQCDNFDSQLLNRDVWSDKEVRKLIRRQFMLWQVDSESSQGRRFVTFYHCAKLPYICIIDPRTGEEVWKNQAPKQSNVLPDLQKFLLEHKDLTHQFERDAPSTSKRSAKETMVTIEDCNNVTISSPTKHTSPKRRKVADLTEDEQVALAIRNSMKEKNGKYAHMNTKAADVSEGENSSDFDSVEEFEEVIPKENSEALSYADMLGENKNELTTLKVRLINKEGVDEVVQLSWPSDTRLQVLRMYFTQHHSHIHKKGYKLICAFPRKTLEPEHDLSTLKEMGLHPSANLHVTLD